jgi:hypothetical protein
LKTGAPLLLRLPPPRFRSAYCAPIFEGYLMKMLPLLVSVAVMSVSLSIAHAGGVEDADAAKVANCTFVKDISAPTSTGKHTREALGAAMENARDDAAKAGATHIVWNKIVGHDVSNVSGKAYRCAK